MRDHSLRLLSVVSYLAILTLLREAATVRFGRSVLAGRFWPERGNWRDAGSPMSIGPVDRLAVASPHPFRAA